MNREQRQIFVRASFTILLVITVLSISLYLSDHSGINMPELPSWTTIANFLLEKFNIFNYL